MKEATHRKNLAWWVWLVVASFLLQFGLVLRNDWVGPTLGVRAHYDQGRFLIADIYALDRSRPWDFSGPVCSSCGESECAPHQQVDLLLREFHARLQSQGCITKPYAVVVRQNSGTAAKWQSSGASCIT
jgi:hypothetical protein